MVIEPTDEMVQLAVDKFLDGPSGTIGEIDGSMRDALAAVLAIVERDYDVRCGRRRPLDDTGYAELACSMTAGHEGPHRWIGDDMLVEWP